MTRVSAAREASSSDIELQIEGDGCGGEIFGFTFKVEDDSYQDVTGRSWAETDFIDQVGDGPFILHGAAVSCGNFDNANRIEVSVLGSESNSGPRSTTIDVY